MKIALISDLHIDINESYPVMKTLSQMAKEEKAEGIIIAGDLSEDVDLTRKSAENLEQDCGCPVWYVPGNHDMWSRDFEKNSTDEIYEQYRKDKRCLVEKPVSLIGKLGRFFLIGDIGWYDYSFASHRYSESQLEQMRWKSRIWQDSLRNQWTKDNRAKSEEMVKKLEKELLSCGNVPVVVVTHMLPVNDFCVPEQREEWGYFNGFLGSSALGELYKQYPVIHAVCGHVHFRAKVKRDGIQYHCPCLGYWTEWEKHPQYFQDVRFQLEQSIQWIDL